MFKNDKVRVTYHPGGVFAYPKHQKVGLDETKGVRISTDTVFEVKLAAPVRSMLKVKIGTKMHYGWYYNENIAKA